MDNDGKESFAGWLMKQKIEQNQAIASEVFSTASTLDIDPKLLETARAELNRMVKIPGNAEPDRGDLDDDSTEWRCGKPNYTLANLAFLKGKCQAHKNGSLEMIVENAVKTVKTAIQYLKLR